MASVCRQLSVQAKARPQDPVILITGDGSLMMNIQ